MNILEASLARIWHHYRNNQFAFLTSWREGDNPKLLSQNKQRFEQLRADVQAAGYGFVPLLGVAKEELSDAEVGVFKAASAEEFQRRGVEGIEYGPDGKAYRVVKEPSIIVLNLPGPPSKRHLGPTPSAEFKQFIIGLGQKYNQDSILLATPGEGTDLIGLKPDVHTEDHFSGGHFNDSIVSKYFSALKPGANFSFEAVLAVDRPRGTNAWMKGMAREAAGEHFDLLQKPVEEQLKEILKWPQKGTS